MSFEGGDKKSIWDRANSPENIEVVKTDVQYEDNAVFCELHFAKAVDHETLEDMFKQPDSTLNALVSNVFLTKGWAIDDESIEMTAEDSEDGKTWQIFYRKVEPKSSPKR